MNEHWAIANPVRLYAEPVGLDGDRFALVAEDAEGRQLTILATRERFTDALMSRGLQGPMSQAEQVRSMFIRDEVDLAALERAVERELRRSSGTQE